MPLDDRVGNRLREPAEAGEVRSRARAAGERREAMPLGRGERTNAWEVTDARTDGE